MTGGRPVTLRVPTSLAPAPHPDALAALAALAALFLLLVLARGADGARVDLPASRTRADAGRGAACVVLAPDPAAPPGRDAPRLAFSDGDSPSRPLGAATDVYLAALRVLDADPGRPFAVRARAGVRYALVDDVIEQLRRAGVREVTLLTRAAPEEAAP